jgi:hypothetical protein
VKLRRGKKKQIHKVYQLKKIEKKKKVKEYIPEHGREEKELRRGEKRKKWILMFFTYGKEEEEEKKERSPVCCEIKNSRFYMGRFTDK